MEKSIDFTKFYKLKPAFKKYAWGSVDKIQKIVNIPSDGQPLAEIWMGNHICGMTSVMLDDNKTVSMNDFISSDPVLCLGESCLKKFNGSLPFLFKILAAEKPLSIQAHPCKEKAEEGFRRENMANIAFDHFSRNYKDNNHKREIIYPVTEFIALKGFRKAGEIRDNFVKFCGDAGEKIVDFSFADESEFYRTFFKKFMTMDSDSILAMTEAVEQKKNSIPLLERVIFMKLCMYYPDDKFVLAPFFINCFMLKPGDCLFINDGELHSYVEGTCFEIMSASDNVLRGGLTSKNIDLDELFNVVTFAPGKMSYIQGENIDHGKKFSVSGDEFYLSEIKIDSGDSYAASYPRNIEILFIYEGKGTIKNSSFSMDVKKGDSILVPAEAGKYEIFCSENLVAYKASVPL